MSSELATKWLEPPPPNETNTDSQVGGGPSSCITAAQPESGARRSAATELVALAAEFNFFHDQQQRAFVRLGSNEHREVWPVVSKLFRTLLAERYWRQRQKAANRNALSDAIATLEGRAMHDAPEEQVFIRVAPHGENLLIDLCDPLWRVIEVRPNGWSLLDCSPVAFIRTSAMRPLPLPRQCGSIARLWTLLNVTEDQRALIAGALLNFFDPRGPYFVLNFVGEQGTAKSCAARIIRQLVDPSETPLRSPPKESRDLQAQAASNHIIALDNLSRLPNWLSDELCRLSTGGGISARTLYTDLEETSLNVKRPVVLNGIEDVAARPDLAERALQVELETISDSKRMTEKALWESFEQGRAEIFGAILDALVMALHDSPGLKMDTLPRMADAVHWAAAGEMGFGFQRGDFRRAYETNIQAGAVSSVEGHPVGVAIMKLLASSSEWSGEPAQLLETLSSTASDEMRHSAHWPRNPRGLSSCLRRLAPALRKAGLLLEIKRDKRRHIRLCKPENFASEPSSASLLTQADANDANFPALH